MFPKESLFIGDPEATVGGADGAMSKADFVLGVDTRNEQEKAQQVRNHQAARRDAKVHQNFPPVLVRFGLLIIEQNKNRATQKVRQ
jgi:hypothetical protein